MFRILVVEDDKSISRLLELELTHAGYIVKIAKDGDEALKLYENFKPDIILLDIMLPIRDGFEVAEAIRDYDSDIGIIMITARGELESKVKGLKNADDYVVKPFEIEEILARIEALLKRMGKTKELIKVGDIEIYPQNMEVLVNKNNVHLSLTEFNILKLLALNKNIVVSKEKILEEIWGYYDEENNNLVEVYINYLRKKLKDSTQNIETVRGVGYVIREKESKT
ncbi:response regulator ArlR [Petrotoga sp. HKA.pet.4.5]|jgi:DNA-binding response OmpR family regulator|uniref:response regulator transcription factor n=1 Tax=unclassified Petrotoga TaxID=2620614 RepID=UPI000EF13F25|nr:MULTISPECIES: response regulator transcription factor [unclassified Petrotoga]RLL83290.1 response regulator ArlR [Petrotoga sp. Shatin.DS.tank11.9.2.9.3]RLL90636.1 response regulator ArlR [Petrotoga sp. HKA.pet.4.5]